MAAQYKLGTHVLLKLLYEAIWKRMSYVRVNSAATADVNRDYSYIGAAKVDSGAGAADGIVAEAVAPVLDKISLVDEEKEENQRECDDYSDGECTACSSASDCTAEDNEGETL